MFARDEPETERLSPEQLPDPWLLDTEGLLSELARIRELAFRIPPVRNDVLGPVNSVVDALWDLEERLRYCFHLHCEAQRSFARRHDKNLPNRRNAMIVSTRQPSPDPLLSLAIRQRSLPPAGMNGRLTTVVMKPSESPLHA